MRDSSDPGGTRLPHPVHRSVRAWRQLRFNKKYAEKLEKKLARRKEKEARQAQAVAEAAAKRAQPKSNPFAVRSVHRLNAASNVDHSSIQLGGTSAPNPFGMGSQIFGGTAAQNNTTDCDADDAVPAALGGSPPVSFETDSEDDGDENEDGDDDDDTLAAAFESTSLDDSPWKQSPAYSPLYLSTVSEYLPPPPKVKVPAAATVDPDEDRASKDGGGWTLEGYENSIDIDHAFERFSKRVSHEGEQCLRYAHIRAFSSTTRLTGGARDRQVRARRRPAALRERQGVRPPLPRPTRAAAAGNEAGLCGHSRA